MGKFTHLKTPDYIPDYGMTHTPRPEHLSKVELEMKSKTMMQDLSPDFLDELMEEVNNSVDGDVVISSDMILEDIMEPAAKEIDLKMIGVTRKDLDRFQTEEWADNNIIPRNKYMREIAPGFWVDVYDVIEAFEVTDGGMQHALKKILACGQRGHKDEEEDRKDILVSIKRSNEIFEHKRLEK
jgi:hypothetical protein